MKIDFRIDFGYQYLYSRKHYHPVYVWDGMLECENGEILNTYQLDYPYLWFGPGRSAKETKIAKPEWKLKQSVNLKASDLKQKLKIPLFFT